MVQRKNILKLKLSWPLSPDPVPTSSIDDEFFKVGLQKQIFIRIRYE